MFLSSYESGLIKVFSVFSLILLECCKFVLQLRSSGLKKVIDSVSGSLNVNISILNVLLKRDYERVVLVSSDSEIKIKVTQFFIEVLKQIFNSINEFLNCTTNLWVKFSHIKNGSSPFALWKLAYGLLSGFGSAFKSKSKGTGSDQ